MTRLARIAPVLLIAAGFLALAATGIPLYSRMQPLLEHYAPGVVVNKTPASPTAVEALDRHAKSELSTSHSAHGHGLILALWVLAPLAALFPLALAWRSLPSNRARIAGFTTAILGVCVALFLMTSLTGHELGGLIRSPDGVSRVAVRRSLLIHAISLPVLLAIVLGALVWIHARIARPSTQTEPQK